MRKILFLGLFFLIAFTSFAQIQNKFFNCELGKATYNEVLTNITKLGYSISSNERNGEMTNITIFQSSYNGHNWEAISIIFYKDSFYKIMFSNMSRDKSIIDENYSLFEILFTTKYKENLSKTSPQDEKLTFWDFDNDIGLDLMRPFMKKDIYIFLIQYTSMKINEQAISDGINAY